MSDVPAELHEVTVDARPNKDFFVSMLTRDIELQDAILDLLDNALDGVHRTLNALPEGEPSQKPYEGFSARLEITPDRFVIEDNCGGIPRDIAVNKAFRMGRPPGSVELEGAIGMYGIGMKRAIFKMGREAVVESSHDEDGFTVTISREWMSDPGEWRLPITDGCDAALKSGTRITVSDLRDEIAHRFDPVSDIFLQDLADTLAQHYGLIITKGFEVQLNGTTIEPVDFTLMVDKFAGTEVHEQAIHPYVYKGSVEGVNVEIYAGLYRRLPDEEELDRSLETKFSSDDAGWTIACNDRIVLYRDKTVRTGWGTGGVPSYHNQFIAFTGIVLMTSDDPWRLPLTTTKRGVDVSTDLYQRVLDLMRDATRVFTSFTNRWKKYSRERSELYAMSAPVALADIKTFAENLPYQQMRSGLGGRKYSPSLPPPPRDKATNDSVRISFQRSRTDLDRLAIHFFDETSVTPARVGEECFDWTLKQIQRN